MIGLKFHHVGVACEDLERAVSFVLSAYTIVSDSGTVYDPEQDAEVRIFNRDTAFAIELVSGNAVANIVRRGTTYYHLCYATPNIHASIAAACELGAICVREPKPAVLFEGRLVAFVFTPIGLVEFLQQP